MANLERRIEALEHGTQSFDAVAVIVRQIVSPGALRPENSYCQIEGNCYTRADHETPADFDARMLTIAGELNRHRGPPIRIIFSPTNFHS